jgi:hypothetical protein
MTVNQFSTAVHIPSSIIPITPRSHLSDPLSAHHPTRVALFPPRSALQTNWLRNPARFRMPLSRNFMVIFRSSYLPPAVCYILYSYA